MDIIKHLFSNQQVRNLNLARLLNQKDHQCDYSEICHHLDCSFLTMQSEIAHLASFPEVQSLPYIEPHLTVSYHHEFGPRKLYQSILLESPSLRLIEVLFFQSFPALDDLAEELFISLSTLKRLIKRTNLYLQLGFDCMVGVMGIRNISIIGEEEKIRLLYSKYFSEAYDSHVWPFDEQVDEQFLSRLLKLIAKKTTSKMDLSLFHHLKITAAVNLFRFSQGHGIDHIYSRSRTLFDQLETDPEFQELAELFSQAYALPLDVRALSEMFSHYLQQELVIDAQADTYETSASNYHIPPNAWLGTLESIEKKFSLQMPNKREIARLLHNATILQDKDTYEDFLVYDYREPYIDYFASNYAVLLEGFQTALLSPFEKRGLTCSKEQQRQLLYLLLINWDNLFLRLSHAIPQQRVLIIERGSCNTGQFLQAYSGHYFDITIHDHYEVDMHQIKDDYDLVLTDINLENVDGVDIYFFSQFVPSLVIKQLNLYWKEKIQSHFMQTDDVPKPID